MSVIAPGKKGSAIFILALALLIFHFSAQAFASGQDGEIRSFSQFSASLPPDWDGEEQKGFISGDPDEYLLVLGKKDDSGDRFMAQISIYLLPNRPGASPEEAARRLAEAQADASSPVPDGNMWSFTGEPRTNVIKGVARTMVNTNADKMLIIIAQDPAGLGSDKILSSLAGVSPEAKALLGRQ